MLVELGLVEQRYRAVLEVLNDGATVTDVAKRYGVVRQTVRTWLRKYAAGGTSDGATAAVVGPFLASWMTNHCATRSQVTLTISPWQGNLHVCAAGDHRQRPQARHR